MRGVPRNDYARLERGEKNRLGRQTCMELAVAEAQRLEETWASTACTHGKHDDCIFAGVCNCKVKRCVCSQKEETV